MTASEITLHKGLPIPLSTLRWMRDSVFARPRTVNTCVILTPERLEERWVPDAYRWRPGIGSNLLWSWANGSNWQRLTGGNWPPAQNGDYPGANGRTGDTAMFDEWSRTGNTAAYDCTMNTAVTLKALTTDAVYQSTITLQQTLTIKDGTLETRSGSAVLKGNQFLRQLDLDGTTTFNWYAGTLYSLQVIVESGSRIVLPLRQNG